MAVTFRKRVGSSLDRVLQLQVVGCRDLMQSPPSDTIFLNHSFAPTPSASCRQHPDTCEYPWFAIHLTLDVSATGDGTTRLYVDGHLVVSAGSLFDCTTPPPQGDPTYGAPTPAFASLRVGPMAIGAVKVSAAAAATHVFDGFLDEVAVFPFVLTPAQVAAQLAYLPKPDRILVSDGYAALLPARDSDCQVSMHVWMHVCIYYIICPTASS